jgi:hypothetical protein
MIVAVGMAIGSSVSRPQRDVIIPSAFRRGVRNGGAPNLRWWTLQLDRKTLCSRNVLICSTASGNSVSIIS